MFQSIKSRPALAAFAAISAMIAASAAMAASSSGIAFDVKITVSAGCTISNDNAAVDFGLVAGNGAKPTARTKNAVVICSTGVPYDFHITSTNNLRMKNAAGDAIPYTVKLGSSATPLGTTAVTSGFTQTGNGGAQTLTFTFDISSWNATTPYANAQYTDTATLSVDF